MPATVRPPRESYLSVPDAEPLGGLDRARGALVGLAVGDALGTTLEFGPRRESGEYHVDLTGGGPFRLEPGQWTDDAALAVALGESLVESRGVLDRADALGRFVAWYERGAYSCDGRCFDVGNQTRAALGHFRTSGRLRAPLDEPGEGNGGVMRLAPAAIVAGSPREALGLGVAQSTLTHGSRACCDAAGSLATALWCLLAGDDVEKVLQVDRLRRLPRDAVGSTGHAPATLEAAYWAVATTASFRDAVVEAANLGGDADTNAAVAGQVAGALYGWSGIPEEWRRAVAWGPYLAELADRLYLLRPGARAELRESALNGRGAR